MTNAHDPEHSLFNDLLAGIRNIGAHRRGEIKLKMTEVKNPLEDALFKSFTIGLSYRLKAWSDGYDRANARVPAEDLDLWRTLREGRTKISTESEEIHQLFTQHLTDCHIPEHLHKSYRYRIFRCCRHRTD